jgi:uracil phosphoribosyltransferase
MLRILSSEFSIVGEYIRELRDVQIQLDRNKFRNNLRRIGQLAAYELSKTLEYKKVFTQSPLGVAQMNVLKSQPVIAGILRAGIPLQQGVSDMFDQADLAYVSAYRKHKTDHEFEIVLEYVAAPPIDHRDLIICDPMLATGQSLVQTYNAFKERGVANKIIIVSVVGSKIGVDFVQKHIPEAEIYIGVVDEMLDDHGYIVPGLGDAGDLSFGEKI